MVGWRSRRVAGVGMSYGQWAKERPARKRVIRGSGGQTQLEG